MTVTLRKIIKSHNIIEVELSPSLADIFNVEHGIDPQFEKGSRWDSTDVPCLVAKDPKTFNNKQTEGLITIKNKDSGQVITSFYFVQMKK